jgi:hypothetical protein
LFLKNGAGGVHDQLWQKCPVETNERIEQLETRPRFDSTVFSASVLRAPTQSLHIPGLFSAHSTTFSLRPQRLKAFDPLVLSRFVSHHLKENGRPQQSHCVDYLRLVGENKRGHQHQNNCVLNSGPVAQLGARFHGMEEVAGSIPARSTK